MKTYSTRLKVLKKHLDQGNHANWLAQFKMAEAAHFEFRNILGFGLEELQNKHNLFLVMREVNKTRYGVQLKYRESVDVTVQVWVSRPTCLQFTCVFHNTDSGRAAFDTSWEMAMINGTTGRPCGIPSWIRTLVGQKDTPI